MVVGVILRSVRALVVSAAVVLVLAACSGSDPSQSRATSTGAPAATIASATPTASTPRPTVTKPVPPAAMSKADDNGALAFFDYFWQTYHYSYLILDPAPLEAISDSKCKFCASAATDIKFLRDRDQTVEGGEVSVVWATTPKGDPHDGAFINAMIHQAELRTYGPNGALASTDKVNPEQRIDAVVDLQDNAWLMMEIRVIKKGEQ